MAASAPMQRYMGAVASNRMRDQMGQSAMAGAMPGAAGAPAQPDMDAMMADMMAQKAQGTIAGRGRKPKRKAKK